MNKSDVLACLHTNHATAISFRKVNGEFRNMLATLNENAMPEQITLEEYVSKRKPNEDVCAVFDIQKGEWRSFRWDHLLTVNGKDFVSGSE